MPRPDPRTRTLIAVLILATALAGLAGAALARGIGGNESPAPGPGGLVTRTVLLATFLVLVFLPFLPSVAEVFHPQDEYPLRINLEYAKDPRYLGRSAWKIVHHALEGTNGDRGSLTVRMSKEEIVEVSGPRTVHKGEKLENVLFVDGDLRLEGEVRFERDLYVTGDATIGRASTLRALAGKGSVRLEPECSVTRWVDADAGIEAEAGCSLGASAASGGALRLARGTRFRRLFGHPVETAGAVNADAPTATPPWPARPSIDVDEIDDITDTADLHDESLAIGANERHDRPLVVRGDLELGPGAAARGPIRVYGRTEIGAGARVDGDLFCEGPVRIGGGAVLSGNLFSQDRVEIDAGVVVGSPERPKSVIAKKAIRLAGGIRVHGYLLTEGEGTVV